MGVLVGVGVGPSVGTSVGIGVGIATAVGTGVVPIVVIVARTNLSPPITTVALAPSWLLTPDQLIGEPATIGVASMVTVLPGTYVLLP